ncbi:unnamed protein product, partial [Ectocarpus sp. 4 AP-2014]
MKDLAKLGFFADIVKRMTAVIKFVKNHHATSAISNSHSKLRLINPHSTRFATHFICAMRILKLKTSLKNFAADQRTSE